jgi:soluble lytic murein transglycosylase-like protein
MKKVKLLLVFLAGAVTYLLASLFFMTEPKDPYLGEMSEDEMVNSAPAIQMYFYIKKYSKQYGVPEAYAFAVAYHETRYKGPLDLNYDHRITSSAGAVGPMQIIPQYAHKYAGRRVTAQELKNNIQLNVKVSMKMLRKWYDIHKNWGLAVGAYNTGQPVLNGYARSVINKEYHWVKM